MGSLEGENAGEQCGKGVGQPWEERVAQPEASKLLHAQQELDKEGREQTMGGPCGEDWERQVTYRLKAECAAFVL